MIAIQSWLRKLAGWAQSWQAALLERINANGFLLLMLRTIKKFSADNMPAWSAMIAYYVLFSIFPLLLGLIAIFAYLVGTQEAQETVLSFLSQALPVSEDLIAENIEAVVQARGVIGLVSTVTLLWAATGIFSAFTVAFNLAWEVREGRPFLSQKLLELAVILAIVSILPLSLLSGFVFQALSGVIPELGVFLASPLFALLAALVPLVLTYASFLALYLVFPNTDVTLSDIWLPTLIVVLVFDVLNSVFGWYVTNFVRYELVFGSLGAVVAFLFWAYVAALVLLFGAELAAQYGKLRAEVRAARRAAAPEAEIELQATRLPPADEDQRRRSAQPTTRAPFALLATILALLAAAALAIGALLRIARSGR